MKTDSLRSLVPSSDDTTKAFLYKKISQIYRENLLQYDSVHYYADKILALIGDRTSPRAFLKAKALAMGEKSLAYSYTGLTDSSFYTELRLIEFCKDNDLHSYEVQAATRLLSVYNDLGMYRKVVDLVDAYDKKLVLINDSIIKANYLNSSGTILNSYEDSTAADRLIASYELFKKIRSPYARNCLLNLGAHYSSVKLDFNKALQYYNLYLKEISPDNIYAMIPYYISIGILYNFNYDFNMEQRFDKEASTDSAIVYLKKGLDLSVSGKLEYYAYMAAFHMADLYGKNRNFREALRYSEISLDLAAPLGDSVRVSRVLPILGDAYSGIGQKEKAYDVFRRAQLLNNYLNLKKQESEIKNLRLKQKLEQFDNERLLQEKGIRLLKLKYSVEVAFASFLVLIFCLLIFYHLKIVRNKKYLFKRIYELTGTMKKVIENVPALTELPDSIKVTETAITGNPETSSLPLKTETVAQIRFRLQNWIRDKMFLEENTVNSLASKLNTNSKYLSKVITEHYNFPNFNGFINSLRIKYCLLLLDEEPIYRSYKIESLSEMLGFGSKTTFVKVFRDYTGLTPGFYIEQLKKKGKELPAIAG